MILLKRLIKPERKCNEEYCIYNSNVNQQMDNILSTLYGCYIPAIDLIFPSKDS